MADQARDGELDLTKMTVAERLRIHRETVQVKRNALAVTSKSAVSAAAPAATAVVGDLNRSAVQLFQKQVEIENEAKELHTQARAFNKATSQWVNLFEAFNLSLKELGDLHNWSSLMQMNVDKVLKNVEDLRSHNS